MFNRQSDMINETVKCNRERTTSTSAYGAREDLFGIPRSIQALHSRKKFLLAEVQKTNAGKWTGLVFAPLPLTSHCWNVCESRRKTGTSEVLHPWSDTLKCGRRRKEGLWIQA